MVVVSAVAWAEGHIRGTHRLLALAVGDWRSPRILGYTLERGCELDAANADGTSIIEGSEWKIEGKRLILVWSGGFRVEKGLGERSERSSLGRNLGLSTYEKI